MSKRVEGDLNALRAPDRRALERLHRRKSAPHTPISHELGTLMARLSFKIGRQIGVLIDRRGRVDRALLGDRKELLIPKLDRSRSGTIGTRLRGLRLVHTHLNNEPLSSDDLNDLLALRLDLIMAIGMKPDGEPDNAYIATLKPDIDAGQLWTVESSRKFNDLDFDPLEAIKEIESDTAPDGRAREVKSRDRELTAVMAHVSTAPKSQAEFRLDELEELARSEKIRAIGRLSARAEPDSETLLGAARLKELLIKATSASADMILFDAEMTPRQIRAIERLTDIPLLDRTELILDIFARRAGSADAKMRVELARARYLAPKLGLKDDALSRIRGGLRMRGPGETTVEVARRRINERIRRLEKTLENFKRAQLMRRERRLQSGIGAVAIVGYTNAGKSTLLNALTNADALVEDKLFATLEPKTRKRRLDGVEILFSDTVGFIRDLPERLLDAFRSTLEEARDADLLLHIVDISAPDYENAIKTVEEVLASLGLDSIPRALIFNKIDRADIELARFESDRRSAILISALNRINLDRLLDTIVTRLGQNHLREKYSSNYNEQR